VPPGSQDRLPLFGLIPGIDKPACRIVQSAAMMKHRNEDRAFALFDAIFDAGGNCYDTAHIYGQGDSERTLGRWIRSRNVRAQIVLIDKGAHPDGDRPRVNPADITRDLLLSLERLQTDHIDLYLLHRDDPAVPVGPIVEALHSHYQSGLIRAFGGSNWTTERLAAANAFAARHGLRPFVASSPHFSLAQQVAPPWPGCVSIATAADSPARAWYRQHDVALICWSVLAGGWLSGRLTEANQTDFDAQIFMPTYTSDANWQRLRRARQLAGERGLSVAQVALAFVLSQPERPFAVLAAQTATEFREALAAIHVTLTDRDRDWLEHGDAAP
jgi:aryl-alcohol dehydrogenase-like predicted oxidoreductase